MSITIFLSSVTQEFPGYREALARDLRGHNVKVDIQEDFNEFGDYTLEKLDDYIRHVDVVVHLVGERCGAAPNAEQRRSFFAKNRELSARFPALADGAGITYTQFEAWLALYRDKKLLIALARGDAQRAKIKRPTEASRAAQVSQADHLKRLEDADRWPTFDFSTPDELAKHVLRQLVDLLAEEKAAEKLKAFAEQEARKREAETKERRVAEGFVGEVAARVEREQSLSARGKMLAVRNAIDIYLNEIATKPEETNLGDIVARALKKAKAQFDEGQSALADATLARAAEEIGREEQERRELFVANVTQLRTRQRDLALAAFEPDRAVEAILALGNALFGADAKKFVSFLESECDALRQQDLRRGGSVHLLAEISLRRKVLAIATEPIARGRARDLLGLALLLLGEREKGTERLDEAVNELREALSEGTRDRAPLNWAKTQNDLGLALMRLGERRGEPFFLNEAVHAFRAALEEHTRERTPLQWAMALDNLGTALRILGERESGTTRLEEAVAASRAALEELTRERMPRDWALAQANLAFALWRLGERQTGTTNLEEAVKSYRAALTEFTPETAPLNWVSAHLNMGNALNTLGARKNDTELLEQAVAEFRLALQAMDRAQLPLGWATAQNSLGTALSALADHESGTARLEEAIAAFRAALEERTRERDPLAWARTMHNLGSALSKIGDRQSGTQQLEEAIATYHEALEVRTRERVPPDWAMTQNNLGNALRKLGERERNSARLEEAVAAYRAALEVWTFEADPYGHEIAQQSLSQVLELLGARSDPQIINHSAPSPAAASDTGSGAVSGEALSSFVSGAPSTGWVERIWSLIGVFLKKLSLFQ